MNEQLRKRLEEAARETSGCSTCIARKLGCEERCSTYFVAHRGAELGYKEVIAQAKEWLKTSFFQCQGEDDVHWDSAYSDITEALEFFESDMNKLWEEKK